MGADNGEDAATPQERVEGLMDALYRSVKAAKTEGTVEHEEWCWTQRPLGRPGAGCDCASSGGDAR